MQTYKLVSRAGLLVLLVVTGSSQNWVSAADSISLDVAKSKMVITGRTNAYGKLPARF